LNACETPESQKIADVKTLRIFRASLFYTGIENDRFASSASASIVTTLPHPTLQQVFAFIGVGGHRFRLCTSQVDAIWLKEFLTSLMSWVAMA
jgi:hypothetical protein